MLIIILKCVISYRVAKRLTSLIHISQGPFKRGRGAGGVWEPGTANRTGFARFLKGIIWRLQWRASLIRSNWGRLCSREWTWGWQHSKVNLRLEKMGEWLGFFYFGKFMNVYSSRMFWPERVVEMGRVAKIWGRWSRFFNNGKGQ